METINLRASGHLGKLEPDGIRLESAMLQDSPLESVWELELRFGGDRVAKVYFSKRLLFSALMIDALAGGGMKR